MSKPDDFGLDLATRIALHEILLEKLFAEAIQNRPDPAKSLVTLRQSLTASFDVEALTAGQALVSDQDREWVQLQSTYGKELAEKFVAKVGRFL